MTYRTGPDPAPTVTTRQVHPDGPGGLASCGGPSERS